MQHIIKEVKEFNKPPACKDGESAMAISFCLKSAGMKPVLDARIVLVC